MKSLKTMLGLLGCTAAALLLSGCGGRRSSNGDYYNTRGAHVTYREEGEVEVDRTAEAYGERQARAPRAERAARKPRAEKPAQKAERPRRERKAAQPRAERRSRKGNGVQDRTAPSTVTSQAVVNGNGSNGGTKTNVDAGDMGEDMGQ